MASPDLSVFQRIKTKQDFDREAAEFLMKKQAAQRQLAGTDPAAVKLANELQAARAAGDVQRVNDLVASAKLLDRGVVMDANGRPMAMGGYGDAVGSIEGAKSAYKQNAENASDLFYKGQIAGNVATAEAGVKANTEPGIQAEIERMRSIEKFDADKAQEYQDFLSNKLPSALSKTKQAQETILGMRGEGGKGLSPDVMAVVGARNILKGAVPGTSDPDNPSLPRVFSGTPAASGAAKIKQAQGQVFLEAYESLRGAGALTNIEGQKGEQAKARLSAAQTEDDFDKALKELSDVLISSSDSLQKREAEARAFLQKRQSQSITEIAPLQMDGEELIPYNPTNMPSDIGLGNVNDDMPKISKAEEAETIFNAKKAIQRGAPVESVRQRLIQNGIDPSKAGI